MCHFYKYGSTKIVTEDSICYLLTNVGNAKFYLFIWFWLIGVAALTVMQLIYRVLILLVPSLRVSLIMCQTKKVPKTKVTYICHKINKGDWFIIYLLGKNLDGLIFDEFINELHNALDNKKTV
jgi:hypothetical protein